MESLYAGTSLDFRRSDSFSPGQTSASQQNQLIQYLHLHPILHLDRNICESAISFTEKVEQHSSTSLWTGHAKLLLSMPYPHGSMKKNPVSLTWPYSLATEIFIDLVTVSPTTVGEYSCPSIFSQNPAQQSTMYQMYHLEDQPHQ